MAQANSSCWPQLPPSIESLQLAQPLPSPPIPPTQHSCPDLDTQSSKKGTSTSVFIKRPWSLCYNLSQAAEPPCWVQGLSSTLGLQASAGGSSAPLGAGTNVIMITRQHRNSSEPGAGSRSQFRPLLAGHQASAAAVLQARMGVHRCAAGARRFLPQGHALPAHHAALNATRAQGGLAGARQTELT